MSGIRAGRLRDKVVIESYTVTKDAIGGEVQSWSTYATRSCSIEPINGKEFFAAQGESKEVSVRIRFRYESDMLNTKRRLVDNRVSPNVIYDIESVIDPGNEHRELIAMCVVRDGEV